MKNLAPAMAIVSLPIIISAYLVWVDLAPSGVREAHLTVGETSPLIDRVLPDQRVENGLTTESGDAYTRVFDEPAYFSVHPPYRHFEQIEVELEYQNHGLDNFRLALLTDLEKPGYVFRDLIIDDTSGEWTRAHATFDLLGVPLEFGAYKFVLSLPDIKTSHGELWIHSTTVRFKKPPMSLWK